MTRTLPIVALLLATGLVPAADVPETEPVATVAAAAQAEDDAPEAEPAEGPAGERAAKDGDATRISGMSILGNQEAPKSLVIVPWKSSQIGESPGISTMLDDTVQPVDRDVFLRALRYHEIRSETTP